MTVRRSCLGCPGYGSDTSSVVTRASESFMSSPTMRRLIPEVPAGTRLTGRLRRSVAHQIGEGLAVSVASLGLMSWPIAHAAFIKHADAQLAEPEPVRVLGIDETRRGRPRWSQDSDSGKWVKLERFETNFVDLSGPQGLLGQASGRKKSNVVEWLDARGQAWKDQV